jgi:hypothetical protein
MFIPDHGSEFLYRITDSNFFYPGSRIKKIPGSRIKKIPGSGSVSASKFYSII